MMKCKKIILSIAAVIASSAWAAPDFSSEVNKYKKYVEGQIDALLAGSYRFVDYLKAGDIENAKKIFPLVRMHYERSEPIAESFGELDPRIDARLADLTEEAKETGSKTDEEAEKEATAIWLGFHHIEKILWVDKTTKGTADLADKLLADIKELSIKVPTAEIGPQDMINGAVDLLNEVATSKITGEENIFAKTDLFDFQANIDGAEVIFKLFEKAVKEKNPELAKEIASQFDAVNTLLKKHNRAKDGKGYDYIPYNQLSKQDINELSQAVTRLGEPLAQMGIILE